MLLTMLISFVDRDMLMRFLGGGIGHRGAAVQQESIYDDHEDGLDHTEEGAGEGLPQDAGSPVPSADEPPVAIENTDIELEDTVAAVSHYDDGEQDYGYEASDADSDADANSSDEDDDDDDMDGRDYGAIDELGAEDGEETADMDEEIGDREGYARF